MSQVGLSSSMGERMCAIRGRLRAGLRRGRRWFGSSIGRLVRLVRLRGGFEILVQMVVFRRLPLRYWQLYRLSIYYEVSGLSLGHKRIRPGTSDRLARSGSRRMVCWL